MSHSYGRLNDADDGPEHTEVIFEAPGSAEREALLSSSRQETFDDVLLSPKEKGLDNEDKPRPPFKASHVTIAFVTGIVSCVLAQLAICGPSCFTPRHPAVQVNVYPDAAATALAPPWVGSSTAHNFPPAKPTNAFPSMFPTSVGYAGATPTGAEPALIATAPVYPYQSGQCAKQMVEPQSFAGGKPNPVELKGSVRNATSRDFHLFRSWGNLSPWYSNSKGTFGVDSTPEPPETCRITGLHLLHRHGARYPTQWALYAGPSKFARRLHKKAASWNAKGELDFLNSWSYKLGEELLTPFGRKQLFDLGLSYRMKYGFLLQNFTESNTIPVFRTESQDRMLNSALNFAVGFFGLPLEGRYQQSITIEAPGFNNTLAPYDTCLNTQIRSKSHRGIWYQERWAARYLKDARERLSAQLPGFDLTIEDVYAMQQTCAYETVALGYSKFCELFTQEEWEGFDYALDIAFWYESAFGSPVAKVQGIGWIQELVSRLTKTPIEVHNTSTNSTLHNPVTFPLGNSLYVDATHEVVVLNIITALNLTSFARDGPLPYTHIPKNRSFRVAELAPFATNVQFQLLSCTSTPGEQIRVIINDGVAPLTGIRGCPEQKDGMCPVDTFVAAQKEIIAGTDWEWDCSGDWTVPEGTEWETTTGEPPKRKA
ncbi:hypothetical protein EST38_g7881 [Candolleomyces aberdarensis]|uniref:Phosphoglycerate mutase-like protein n=1 Tax=Candolleomyces aberdarensis TaxID=2316362 RepID=A0A4Q2DEL4_9AGAR|nr:hypothetical protein EST38_g7881 [Candolleomyces aberdarensis]